MSQRRRRSSLQQRQPRPFPRQQGVSGAQRIYRHASQRAVRRHQKRCILAGDAAGNRKRHAPIGMPGLGAIRLL